MTRQKVTGLSKEAVKEIEQEVQALVRRAPRDPDRPADSLRWKAKAVFTTHPDGLTIEELHRLPEFGVVSLPTLQRWSSEDDWIAERKRVLEGFGAKLKENLQRQLYSRVAQVRIEQMDAVRDLKKSLFEKSLGAEVKSAEGAAKAALDLMKHELELTKQIAAELTPGAGQVGTIEARNSLTEEEALEAARVVLAARRKAVPVLGVGDDAAKK